MQAHIEPALRAWQAAWASNPVHSLERPNPFGAGPLSADSIPLLDLAYVRLFVNLGRCKEAFWQRDWNGMADELARGTEIFQLPDATMNDVVDPSLTAHIDTRRDSIADLGVSDLAISNTPTQDQSLQSLQSMYKTGQTKREKHLRKAAFYAADSISMSNRLGNTFAEFSSRELPIQCAMCAFDCAQVLAEWITTVQERVGPYLGILGRDDEDLTQVPGVMLLEDEDCKLVDKIKEILRSIENKMQRQVQGSNSMSALSVMQRLPSVVEGGYGCKILIATASLLDRAAVWPGELPHHFNVHTTIYHPTNMLSLVSDEINGPLSGSPGHAHEGAYRALRSDDHLMTRPCLNVQYLDFTIYFRLSNFLTSHVSTCYCFFISPFFLYLRRVS